jgi:hypothetical protein
LAGRRRRKKCAIRNIGYRERGAWVFAGEEFFLFRMRDEEMEGRKQASGIGEEVS